MLVEEKGVSYYVSKGIMTFKHTTDNELDYSIISKEDYLKSNNETDVRNTFKNYVGYLVYGIEFYVYVDKGEITDYDGSLAEIYVDGYLTNLGLAHNELCQGELLLSKDEFLCLCVMHDVEVNWCNK